MKIINYLEHRPKISESAYIAQGACIIGEVEIKANSSIWFNATLRGDLAAIKIGSNSNIQDNSVIHTSRFTNGEVMIGDNVTVGHMAVIHACTIKDNAFVGMRSIVMDHVIVEEYGFVAAGAVVTGGKIIGSKELWAGMPAKFIRLISDEEIKFMQETAQNYVKLAENYR